MDWALFTGRDFQNEMLQLNNGEYLELIQGLDSTLCRELLIPVSLEAVSDDCGNDSENTAIQVYCAGIACLKAFVQQSWTGPSLNWDPNELLEQKLNITLDNAKILKALEVDAESVYHLVKYPVLIYLARQLLVERECEFESRHWWRQRCLFTLQKLLENPSNSLYQAIMSSFSNIELPSDPELRAKYHLELGNIYSFYNNHKQSLENYRKAQECTGLKWEFTGVMGKRTKFQQFETSQLVICATSLISNDSNTEYNALPNNVSLNDDTLLEKMLPSETLAGMRTNLSTIDQCILLSFCLNHRNTNPDDGLVTEQMVPFVSRVLENCRDWTITTMGLILRSRLEACKSRSVERSCLQLQALIDQWTYQTDDASPAERLVNVWSLLVPSKWQLEVELAERFASIGVLRSALEIYTRLEMFEKVVNCHQLLEEHKKAEQVLQCLLDSEPSSPKYLCMMGDIKQDISFYERAWQVSNGRYARAMRSLAYYYFRVENWELSIECFTKALCINQMFENSWFVQGCAALKIGDLVTATNAFMQVTRLEPENSQAWNNLASVYISQKKLKEASNCLREAARINYDSANIWENYLYVLVDLKEFGLALSAMERVYSIRVEKHELRETCIDCEILDKIINQIGRGETNANSLSGRHHLPQLFKLLTTFQSKITSYRLFLSASQLCYLTDDYQGWLLNLEKSFRNLLNDSTVAESLDKFAALAIVALKYCDALVESKDLKQEPRMGGDPVAVCPAWQYKAKMALKPVIGRFKNLYQDSSEYQAVLEKFEYLKQMRE